MGLSLPEPAHVDAHARGDRASGFIAYLLLNAAQYVLSFWVSDWSAIHITSVTAPSACRSCGQPRIEERSKVVLLLYPHADEEESNAEIEAIRAA